MIVTIIIILIITIVIIIIIIINQNLKKPKMLVFSQKYNLLIF